MLKQIYKFMGALLLAGLVFSCSPDTLDDVPLTEGDVPIQLSGALTRALGDPDDPGNGELITTGYPLEGYSGVSFYLTARTAEPSANYFLNQPIAIGDKNTTNEGRNKLNGTVYYPLGKKAINLYAHTGGTVTTDGVLTLNAGTLLGNDYLLGVGTDDIGTTPEPGSSVDPIEYITFKHLMTRVDVRIEVADNIEETKPTSMTMRFTHNGANGPIVNRGTYNIFTGGNDDGNANNNASAEYAFTNITTTAKTHYLVPNGTNLTTYTNQIVSYLKIDDYVASEDDLKALKFSKAVKGTEEVDFILKPGLAYDLTFVINRLKIVDIQLTLKDWDPKSGSTEWDYEPYTVTLTAGESSDYAFSDTNPITKMVLKYESGDKIYQYIGAGRMEGEVNKIDFVTLPQNLELATNLTAYLYTADGLLVDGIEIEASGTDLRVLNLGQYGMKKNEGVLEISTPLQMALMLNDDTKTGNQNYLITKTIDMGGVKVDLTSNDFPTGSVLDGSGNEILNLEISNGLFATNNGTLKNFRIVSGEITGSENVGAISQTNSGTIEGVVNQANIKAIGATNAGGIAGTNSGTIIASVNSGNIVGGTNVGGIVGNNTNTTAGAITSCLNVGMLNKDANNLGGIVGISSDDSEGGPIVNNSFWLTGTARKDQAVSDELAVGNSAANSVDGVSADLAETTIRDAAIGLLNTDLTGWKFELNSNISSWPMAIPVTNP